MLKSTLCRSPRWACRLQSEGLSSAGTTQPCCWTHGSPPVLFPFWVAWAGHDGHDQLIWPSPLPNQSPGGLGHDILFFWRALPRWCMMVLMSSLSRSGSPKPDFSNPAQFEIPQRPIASVQRCFTHG